MRAATSLPGHPFGVGRPKAVTPSFYHKGLRPCCWKYKGCGNSDPGNPAAEGETDAYDLIEWIAAQPWCDGNVGMIGISDFARRQLIAARHQPPHLKAIFPYDPGDLSFRDMAPGGLIHTMRFHLMKFSAENPHDVELTRRKKRSGKNSTTIRTIGCIPQFSMSWKERVSLLRGFSGP